MSTIFALSLWLENADAVTNITAKSSESLIYEMSLIK